jgi:hypothetical protein
MLYNEFVTLTETEVSDEEYRYIEQSYYDSELDKAEFCKLWKQDYDSGKWAVELALRRRLRHMTEELKEREKKIAKLEEQLDREQDWKLSDRAGTHMSQENYLNLRYLALRTDGCGRVLSESDAKKLIVEEFGFQLDKIEIITEVETFEVSRHYRLRRKDTFTREPLYCATDWNYIRFNVGNLQYEMINGELEQYCD